jgi:hypothetical protein
VSEYNIKDLNKAVILKNFYNLDRVNQALYTTGGMLSFLASISIPKMTVEMAEDLLKEATYFDYLDGKVLKINLGSDTLDTGLYDRDYGAVAGDEAMFNALFEMNKIIDLAELEKFKVASRQH